MKLFIFLFTVLFAFLNVPLNCAYSMDNEQGVTLTHPSDGIPNNYVKWKYIQHISGGGGGIHVYEDPVSQKKFSIN